MSLTPLTVNDYEQIAESIKYRQDTFEEPFAMSVGVVIANYGSKYTPIACINGEWSGIKADLSSSGGLPHCPNGHVLLETGPGKELVLREALE